MFSYACHISQKIAEPFPFRIGKFAFDYLFFSVLQGDYSKQFLFLDLNKNIPFFFHYSTLCESIQSFNHYFKKEQQQKKNFLIAIKLIFFRQYIHS